MLAIFPTQPTVVVNTSSASGDWQEALAAPNRTIITATRSAGERNETAFGEFFAKAFAEDVADPDKDGRVTIKEAFEYATAETTRHYQTRGTLQMEHARMEGNAQLARPSTWVRRARRTGQRDSGVDGLCSPSASVRRRASSCSAAAAVRWKPRPTRQSWSGCCSSWLVRIARFSRRREADDAVPPFAQRSGPSAGTSSPGCGVRAAGCGRGGGRGAAEWSDTKRRSGSTALVAQNPQRSRGSPLVTASAGDRQL